MKSGAEAPKAIRGRRLPGPCPGCLSATTRQPDCMRDEWRAVLMGTARGDDPKRKRRLPDYLYFDIQTEPVPFVLKQSLSPPCGQIYASRAPHQCLPRSCFAPIVKFRGTSPNGYPNPLLSPSSPDPSSLSLVLGVAPPSPSFLIQPSFPSLPARHSLCPRHQGGRRPRSLSHHP